VSSASRGLLIVVAAAAVAFGAAFAVGRATTGESDAAAGSAPTEIEVGGQPAQVPSLKATGPLPALRKPPQTTASSDGGSTADTSDSSTSGSTSSTQDSGTDSSGTTGSSDTGNADSDSGSTSTPPPPPPG
jgi:hypothetical protein